MIIPMIFNGNLWYLPNPPALHHGRGESRVEPSRRQELQEPGSFVSSHERSFLGPQDLLCWGFQHGEVIQLWTAGARHSSLKCGMK